MYNHFQLCSMLNCLHPWMPSNKPPLHATLFTFCNSHFLLDKMRVLDYKSDFLTGNIQKIFFSWPQAMPVSKGDGLKNAGLTRADYTGVSYIHMVFAVAAAD